MPTGDARQGPGQALDAKREPQPAGSSAGAPAPCYYPPMTETDPADQAYYWTEAWQAGERAADEERAAGRVRWFATAAEAIRWLQADDD